MHRHCAGHLDDEGWPQKAAVDRGDYETAAGLRDRISLLRNAPAGTQATDFDPAGLVRPTPGTMA
ncbi:UvrB/UvrC motif-containing protein [Sphingobium sp. D43FB]|uniref:UvrB/UvrC motif-containing protein n=1 Tax=Sphingobium sp. D43FB TaxID=2017595 RepID=UPI0031BAD4EC